MAKELGPAALQGHAVVAAAAKTTRRCCKDCPSELQIKEDSVAKAARRSCKRRTMVLQRLLAGAANEGWPCYKSCSPKLRMNDGSAAKASL
jgi:hypothetical protein